MTAKEEFLKKIIQSNPLYPNNYKVATTSLVSAEDALKAMEEYARLKCEEQKLLCAESATARNEDGMVVRTVIKESILTCKNAADE